MTNAELIAALQKLDPTLNVEVGWSVGEGRYRFRKTIAVKRNGVVQLLAQSRSDDKPERPAAKSAAAKKSSAPMELANENGATVLRPKSPKSPAKSAPAKKSAAAKPAATVTPIADAPAKTSAARRTSTTTTKRIAK